MGNIILNIIVILSVLGGIIAYLINRQKKINAEKERIRILEEQRRQEEERLRLESLEKQRKKDRNYIESKFEEVSSLNKDFDSFINYAYGYFNHRKLTNWKSAAHAIYQAIEKIDLNALQLGEQYLTAYKKFRKYGSQAEAIRTHHNLDFVDHELLECNDLFSNIDGASLDGQQRLAIVKDEDHNLIIAGAGSGKTTTVAGKVAYAINRLNVKPEEILLITFTRKASEEMQDRIKKKMGINIEVNTFHSFGRKVIGKVTNDMPTVIDEKLFYTEMKNIFTELMVDSAYAANVIKFLTEYNLLAKETDEFESHGEYINYIKDNNIKSYKTVEKVIEGRRTILREICKSIEEVKIANHLFLNGVNYIYENPYQHKTSDDQYAQYRPDFYLPDYDIYIEHFGLIDKFNNVPRWFSSNGYQTPKDKYNSDIEWKRRTHEQYQTTLVETYSYEERQDVLLNNLTVRLAKHDVQFRRRSSDEIWEILNNVAKDDVSALDTLINTFLNLFKSNNYTLGDLAKEIEQVSDEQTRTRYHLFLKIFEPILHKYNAFLQAKHLIDFSDMINEATGYINENRLNNKFRYIIVDEFQDTSIGRFKLIKALLDSNPLCKLFAVGDDWQSIYRFAGSDISLFTEFEKYFGFTEYSKIETTYRFRKSMIDLSSSFILANPNQTTKQLNAFAEDNCDEPIEVLYGNSFRNDDPLPLIESLKKIDAENATNDKKVKILALSRYNHFVDLYKEHSELFTVKYNIEDKNYIITCKEYPHLPVEYLTVHRSKGLQADYTIILNCVSGQYGFPSEHADDPILNLLLSKSDQFRNGEERRLFYVALTRAKKKTYITTNATYKSKFVNEIDESYGNNLSQKCPNCKLGDKVVKEGISQYGKPFIRYTCSNWNFDCDYLEWG
jgi:DNA helicase IV